MTRLKRNQDETAEQFVERLSSAMLSDLRCTERMRKRFVKRVTLREKLQYARGVLECWRKEAARDKRAKAAFKIYQGGLCNPR